MWKHYNRLKKKESLDNKELWKLWRRWQYIADFKLDNKRYQEFRRSLRKLRRVGLKDDKIWSKIS